MSKVIFKDKKKQEEFEREGYVKISLLDEKAVKELVQFYIDNENDHTRPLGKFHSTNHTDNPDLIARVNTKVRSYILPALEKHLTNFKPMHANFLVKEPGEDSYLYHHQDWSFVDETKYVSANCWVSLEDTTSQNGCMRFIPGSHAFLPTLRIAGKFPWAFENVREQMKAFDVDVPTKAGEAVIFSHALVHSSSPNVTNKARIAAVQGLYSADADLLYFYRESGETNGPIDKFKMTIDDFINIGHDQRPANAQLAGQITFDFRQLSPAELDACVRRKENLFSFITRTVKKYTASL